MNIEGSEQIIIIYKHYKILLEYMEYEFDM